MQKHIKNENKAYIPNLGSIARILDVKRDGSQLPSNQWNWELGF